MKWILLTLAFVNFNDKAHSQLLELDDVNCGYEESRREQVRLQEELALRERERALRDTRIRNIHEMEELRSVQEMRVDEFSMQKKWEKVMLHCRISLHRYRIYKRG